MQTTSLLQELTDNWMLLAMFTLFVGVIIWAFLPSQGANRTDASMIPFRNEDSPAAAQRPNDKEDSTRLSTKLKGHTDV